MGCGRGVENPVCRVLGGTGIDSCYTWPTAIPSRQMVMTLFATDPSTTTTKGPDVFAVEPVLFRADVLVQSDDSGYQGTRVLPVEGYCVRSKSTRLSVAYVREDSLLPINGLPVRFVSARLGSTLRFQVGSVVVID